MFHSITASFLLIGITLNLQSTAYAQFSNAPFYTFSDLFSNTLVNFMTQAEQWLDTSTNPPVNVTNVLTCNGTSLVIGSSISSATDVTRTYFNLPSSYTAIRVTVEIWLIDTWVSTNQIRVWFIASDGNKLLNNEGVLSGITSTSSNSNMCGGPDNDIGPVTLVIKSNYVGPLFTLGINSNAGTIAIGNINVFLYNSTSYNDHKACILPDPQGLVTSGLCSCSSGTVLDSATGLCYNCDSSCSSCSGTQANQCIYCRNSWYLYPNNTCLPNCTEPYVNATTASGQYLCQVACTNILTPYYYYQNRTCRSTCVAPFVLSSKNVFCRFPCSSNTYLYDNGSCLATCPRFINYTTGIESYCKYPCQDINNYLYSNYSCSASCNPLFVKVQENSFLYCDFPCQAGQYVTADGLCVNTCDPCFVPSVQGQYTFCLYPHLPTISQNIDATCIAKVCQGVLTLKSLLDESENIAYCTKKANPISTQTGAIESKEDTLQVLSSLASIISIVIAAKNPTIIVAGSLVKLLQYTRYLKIASYSLPLLLLFKSTPPTMGFLPSIPDLSDTSKDKFGKQTVPVTFEFYQLHSNFFVNYWKDFISLIICLAICMPLLAIEYILLKKRSNPKPYNIARKIRMSASNFLLLQLYLTIGDIVLFFSIQASSTPFSSTPAIITFVIGILFILICSALFILNEYLVRTYQSLKTDSSMPEDAVNKFDSKFESLQILYFIYKNSSSFCQRFLLFALIRTTLANLIIGLLYNYPLPQSIALTCLSVLMIAFILFKRPFKAIVDCAQQLICEIVLLTANIIILSLSIIDRSQDASNDTKNGLSRVIIILNAIMKVLPIVFVGVTALIALIKYLRSRTAKVSQQEFKAPFPSEITANVSVLINPDISQNDLSQKQGVIQLKKIRRADRNAIATDSDALNVLMNSTNNSQVQNVSNISFNNNTSSRIDVSNEPVYPSERTRHEIEQRNNLAISDLDDNFGRPSNLMRNRSMKSKRRR